MKTLFIASLGVLMLSACTEASEKNQEAFTETNSQYVIESNTMIFHDNSIADAIKSRKFYKCIDVFNSNVTAKVTDSPSGEFTFRVISLIYDERQVLDIDLRTESSYADIEFHLLGYSILDNGSGNPILSVIKPYSSRSIQLYVKGMKTDFVTLTNMTNDIQHVMNDQIVQKKDNVGSIPFRRINVYHSDVYAKNFQNNKLFKIVDIYRPAELKRSFNSPPVASQASWFATALPVTANKESSYSTLVYIKNPQIIE